MIIFLRCIYQFRLDDVSFTITYVKELKIKGKDNKIKNDTEQLIMRRKRRVSLNFDKYFWCMFYFICLFF